MAEGKNKITVYRDWINFFEPLTDDEAGKLIKHFFRYVNDKNPEPPDRTTQLLFESIKMILKRDLKKWEEIRDRNIKNGNLGGRPIEKIEEPKQTQSVILGLNKTQANPEKPVNVIDTVIVIDNDIKKEDSIVVMAASPSQNKKFIKPDFIEVENYFVEKNRSAMEAEKFFNYYEANGWRVGKNPMKNWQAASRNWISNIKNFNNSNQNDKQLTKAEREQQKFNERYGTNFGQYQNP